MRIEGCRAVVTGAAIGLGRAIALALAEAGAEVLVVDVDEEGGRTTVTSAPEGRCRFLRADMTVADDIRGMVAAGRPRILVNNAGGGGHVPPHFPEAPAEQWEASLRLNLLGPMLATQAALGPMRDSGGGAVVNVASTAGLGLAPYQSPEYAAAKAGLVRFTSTLTGLGSVRVNCLVPDWVATERLTEDELASRPPPIPLPLVAASTLRLIEDDSLSGRVLVLDRGRPPHLLPPT